MQYKYHKGSEIDFVGAHATATHRARHLEKGHAIFTDQPQIVNLGLFEFTAHREPIQDEKASVTIINNSTDQLIAERGGRYGKFKDGADIMQSLKDVMRDVDGWNNLTASQKEALDMIQHKIGRILNGDQTYDDSWKDIAGYATLIVNELNGEIK